ncbi:hypothetical protein BH10BAC3_BH10BAC3_27820 [soil metagenome]
MRMTKHFSLVSFLVAAALLLTGNKTLAQGYYFYNNGYYESQTVIEGGISVGMINGMTDIGGSKKGRANSGPVGDFTFKESNLSAGLYVNATYKDFIAARLDFSFGRVEAADSNLKGTTNKFAEGRYVRNLSFRTNIFEIGAGVELHPLMMRDYIDKEPPRLSPYVFGGISWIKFNPKAYLNGVWYELEPLRLEGQGFSEYPDRKRYKRNSFAVPYGVGVRYEATQFLNVRLEVAKHSLFTDYLDDVSQENWIDPALFYKYLSPGQAAVASQLYNRSTVINPPRNTRPRGKSNENDAYWNVVIKLGININRVRNSMGFGGARSGGGNTSGGRRAKIKCPSTIL